MQTAEFANALDLHTAQERINKMRITTLTLKEARLAQGKRDWLSVLS